MDNHTQSALPTNHSTSLFPAELQADKGVALWLFGTAASVLGMIVLGGVTRLTRSGLSMTTWRPQGSLPPMTESEWDAEFSQ